MNPLKSYRKWRLQRQLRKARMLLFRIDVIMRKMNMPRWKRKQMWRDFVKSEAQRKNMISVLGGIT